MTGEASDRHQHTWLAPSSATSK